MRYPNIFAAIAALLLLPLWSPAASVSQAAGMAQLWNIDPDHSSVNFSVRHIFVPIPGRFDAFGGTIRFDPDNLEGSSIDIGIDTASVNTFVAKRNEHLRTPDFFDATRYPAMTFKSTRITHTGGDAYLAQGTLTIKDVSRDITLPFTYLGQKKHPMVPDKTVAGFTATLSLKLLDYHVGEDKWQKMGVLGESADIALYMELLR